jgi:hypothetical protein
LPPKLVQARFYPPPHDKTQTKKPSIYPLLLTFAGFFSPFFQKIFAKKGVKKVEKSQNLTVSLFFTTRNSKSFAFIYQSHIFVIRAYNQTSFSLQICLEPLLGQIVCIPITSSVHQANTSARFCLPLRLKFLVFFVSSKVFNLFTLD